MTLESVKVLVTRVQLLATPWTAACQAPLSMEFFGQVYQSGLPFPSSGVLLNPGMEPVSLTLAVDSLPLHHLGSPPSHC